ncbi:triose-phosphate isomerase [Legionella sp. MW5194]|uniref:triose-phosphate isomerase n=1 Tax=Legionella sp. MW5194 TaxID=2662448 RepID=UPI00193CB677|nr:triose-phosphate isomerase [Legionella sp. MW5194]QRN02665.1 triose-phosphate isomerase [Legionella sp. MW5194]
MRKKIVAGNWKMNGTVTTITQLLKDLIQQLPVLSHSMDCAVIPPAIYLPLVQELLQGSGIGWGAQNVYPANAGAYTGELSSPMLSDYQCRYVLVGHSERRHLFGESEKFVADKYHHVKDHGMIPILCVGETLEERQQGKTKDVLTRQLLAIAKKSSACFDNAVIAYEPVWAIGTGQTASPEQAQEMHGFIRELVSEFSKEDAAALPLLYGGSVNGKNAASLFSMPDVDGGLIGGASLNAQQFVEIVKCIN